MKNDLATGLVLSVVGFALPNSPTWLFLVGLGFCIAGGFYLGSAWGKHMTGEQ